MPKPVGLTIPAPQLQPAFRDLDLEMTSMQITRRYTTAGRDPFGALTFVSRTSRIVNPDGTVVFEMKDVLAPEAWSQVAVDILAQKYFRRAGVPARLEKVAEAAVPEWLQRSVPAAGENRIGQETDARQVFRRLAGCWTYWGWKGAYFAAEADARAFHDEVCHMLAAQMAAPNSPQWFNTGLHWAYGIDGPAQRALPRRSRDRKNGAVHIGLRTPGAACVLHSVHQG
jgi:ribonucleoside-diphosphate reductase alpha chain